MESVRLLDKPQWQRGPKRVICNNGHDEWLRGWDWSTIESDSSGSTNDFGPQAFGTVDADADSGSSASGPQFCGCANDVTSGFLGNNTGAWSVLPSLGSSGSTQLPSLDFSNALDETLVYNNLWADPAARYGVMLFGMLGGLDVDLGGEGLQTINEGNFSTYVDTTRPGASVPNFTTSESATDAAANLQWNGYTATQTNGPATIYTGPDGSTYVIRPSDSAPGGWAADYTPAGGSGFTLKINFSTP